MTFSIPAAAITIGLFAACAVLFWVACWLGKLR